MSLSYAERWTGTSAHMATSVNLSTLYEERGVLRREWTSRVSWESVNKFPAQHTGRGFDYQYPINLLAGKHLPWGAKSLRDLVPTARRLVMTAAHAFSILTGAKQGLHTSGNKGFAIGPADAQKKKSLAFYGGRVYLEYLYGRGADADRTIGVRLVFALAEPAGAAGDDADDGSTDRDEAQPRPRKADPLSVGVLASCREAEWLHKEMEKIMAARLKKKKHGPPEPLLQPENTVAWAWAAFRTPSQFNLGPVVAYHRDAACATLADLARLPDRDAAVCDTRVFINSDLRTADWNDLLSPNLYPYDRDFALGEIFTWDAAMCYFTHAVSADQTQRAHYFPDATAGREVVEEVEEEDGMAMLDAILAGQDERPNAGAAWPEHARRFERLMNDRLDTRRRVIHWPRPGTTYALAAQCRAPEVLARMPLPHALGDRIEERVMLHLAGHEVLPAFASNARQALCLAYLQRIEEEQRQSGHLDRMRAFAMTPEAEKEVVPTAGDAERLLNQERSVVEDALVDGQREASACKYLPVLHPEDPGAQVVPSTTARMGTLDFLPGAHLNAIVTRALLEPRLQGELDPTTGGNRADPFIRTVGGHVDAIDPDFVARDDLLDLRLRCQADWAAFITAQKDKLRQDGTTRAARRELRIAFQKRAWALRLQHGETFDAILQTSDNLPDAVKGPLRRFMNAHCFGEAYSRANLRARIKQAMRQRPMTMMMQQLGDVICGLQHASAQSYSAGILCFLCMLDTWTYEPDRSKPALNVLLAGDTGVGKSFVMNQIVTALSVPGIIRNLANITTQAMNTDTSHDHVVFIFEEIKSSWLFALGNDKDKGATPEINFLKQRMTSFFTESLYYFVDETTGKRLSLTCKASHHNVTMGGSNQYLSDMDRNVVRRFIVYFMPRPVSGGDGDSFNHNVFTAFCSSELGRAALHRHHEIYAAFAYISLAIKAGVLPRPLMAAAEYHLDSVLADMKQTRYVRVDDETNRHKVLQLGRNIQIYFACWQAVAGPLREVFFPADGSAPPMWAFEGMATAIGDFLVPTKEALLASTTMLEMLYTPVYMEQLLCVMTTECLHLDAPPGTWDFRKSKDNNGAVTVDCNYVVLRGKTQTDICDYITRHNKEYEVRKEDVHKFLTDLAKEYVDCDQYEPTALDGMGMPLDIQRSATARREKLQAVFFEDDPTKAANSRHQRLCVLVRFLEERLGITAGNAASVGRLRQVRVAMEPDAARQTPFLRAHGTLVPEKRSPLATSLARVLSHPAFERDPKLDAYLTAPSLPFYTAYAPEPITIYKTSSAGEGERRTRRIPLHGMHALLHVTRDAARPVLTRENHTKPLTSAKRTFEQFMDKDADTQRLRDYHETYGLRASECDVDSTFALEWQHTLCHPGLPALDALFFRREDGTMPEDEDEVRPELPYAFGPVLNRIYANLARVHGDEQTFYEYPTANIRDRVEHGIALASGSHVFLRDVDEMMLSNETYGGISFGLGAEDGDEAMDIES